MSDWSDAIAREMAKLIVSKPGIPEDELVKSINLVSGSDENVIRMAVREIANQLTMRIGIVIQREGGQEKAILYYPAEWTVNPTDLFLTELHSMHLPRTQKLSDRCVNTYTPDDIIEHLEEEAIELLLALIRVRRLREPIKNFIEEMIDLRVEINTVITLLIKQEVMPDLIEFIQTMEQEKLDKFENALIEADKKRAGGELINRYFSLFYKE